MRVRISRVLFFGVLAVGVVIASIWDRLQLALDEQDTALTKAERMIQFGLGLPLPGTPDTDKLEARLAEQGYALGSPVFLRIFKAESELEVWMRRGQRYERFAAYPICRWSGKLGPKQSQGDRQAPEGVYTIAADQLNPHSRWHRAFNLGFPNILDRSLNRTGTFLMVHGGCTSIGCYAMTNPVVDEIWRLVTAALQQGQQRFHVHIYPFRMTAENLTRRVDDTWLPFWQDLKYGYDLFEADRVPPKVMACNGHYAFERGALGHDDSAPIVQGCPGTVSTVAGAGAGTTPGMVIDAETAGQGVQLPPIPASLPATPVTSPARGPKRVAATRLAAGRTRLHR